MGIEHYNPFGDGLDYLGISPNKMPDDQTMGEFKAKVETSLKYLYGSDVECGWHEYAWRDG